MQRHVTITEQGRSGTITYTEGSERLDLYWEFGGGDALALLQVSGAGWDGLTAVRRADVLRFVADEVVRQRAPGGHAEVDVQAGSIVLRSGPGRAEKRQEAAAWMGRYSALRRKLGLVVLVCGMLAALLFWLKGKFLTIDPGPGVPLGLAVRTDTHIAQLMQGLEAYTPSPDRDPEKDTYRLSLLLVPLDGGAPKLIPFAEGRRPNSYSLAKVLGSDGRTLWFDAEGLHGVDLRSGKLLPEEAVRAVDERTLPKPWGGAPLEPRVEHYLAAGLFTGPDTWLGLYSDAEAARDLKPKHWLKRIVPAEPAKEQRRFQRATCDPDTSDGHHRIVSVEPLGADTYLNAAFVRMTDASEPIRLSGPPGALMIYTSAPGLKGTLMVARVDTNGTVAWTTDTAIDRFKLEQILPGEVSTAFVGTRLPAPDKLSEPLLVLVDHATGVARTISLWQ